MSLSNTIKSIQDIMRKDVGVDGDAQRISQLEPVINLLLKLSVQSKYIRALRLGWQTNERVIRVT
jgi:hypothetical protein